MSPWPVLGQPDRVRGAETPCCNNDAAQRPRNRLADRNQSVSGQCGETCGLGQAVERLDQGAVLQELALSELSSGMILNQPVKTAKGVLLIEKGQEITFSHLLRLINFSKFETIREPISVLVPSSLRARMVR